MIKAKLKAMFSRVLKIILRKFFPANTTRKNGIYEKHCSFCDRVIEHKHLYLDLDIFLFPALKYTCLKCIAVTMYNMDPLVGPNFLPEDRLRIEEAMIKLSGEIPENKQLTDGGA